MTALNLSLAPMPFGRCQGSMDNRPQCRSFIPSKSRKLSFPASCRRVTHLHCRADSTEPQTDTSDPKTTEPVATQQDPILPPPPVKAAPKRTADSTDWITSAVTRRFGIGAGLGWVGFLAFGVISEQLKTRSEVYLEETGARDVEDAVETALPTGVKYKDLRIGGGASPQLGDLVILSLVGTAVGTTVNSGLPTVPFVDTTKPGSKDIVFTFGAKGLRGGVTEGLVYGLASMKAGGKRVMTVPSELGFGASGAVFSQANGGGGVEVPGDTDLIYEVELKRVSISPS